MGKVKSAIITAFFVAAVIVLALFATVSCDVPGSNGVKRYNSFMTSISMSSELTGDAYALLYPEGVISASYFENDISADNKSGYVRRGSFYVDKEKLGDDATDTGAGSKESEFKASVLRDAKILSARYSERGYSSYSVTIEDDCVIKITVPTGFTYAEYREARSDYNATALTEKTTTLSYLTYSGEIDLWDDTQSIVPIKYDMSSFFKSVSYYAMGGNTAVKITLTDAGLEKINAILTGYSGSSTSAYIYVGETNLQLTLTLGSSLTDKTLYFTATEAVARDLSVLLDSVTTGNALVNDYNVENTDYELIAVSSSFGEYAPVWFGAGILAILLVAAVLSVIKYKKLGLVNILIIAIYALTLITALMLLEIELSIAGMFTAVLGLALLVFTNFYVFEAIRKETQAGRTMHAAIKTGYKKTLSLILDMHIIMVVISAIMTLVCVGEVAACAFILFIASLASYVLYWFTRFMWYVVSSQAKDKFAFCGFTREEDDDDE